MIIEEAVNELDELTMYVEHAFTEEHKCKSFEALQMSIKALEKQIPKEIKREINDGRFERHCPNGCQVTGATMYADIKYCPYCGQAIKWE